MVIELLVTAVCIPGGRSYAEITIVSLQLSVNSPVVVAIEVLSVTVWLKAPDVTVEVMLMLSGELIVNVPVETEQFSPKTVNPFIE